MVRLSKGPDLRKRPNINLNKPSQNDWNLPLKNKPDKPKNGSWEFPQIETEEPQEGLVPLFNSPFYATPAEPADPLDCDRYPDSPYCSGYPFSFEPIGLEPTLVLDECNIGIQLSPTLAFIKLPPTQIVYRKPECRPPKPSEDQFDLFDIPVPYPGTPYLIAYLQSGSIEYPIDTKIGFYSDNLKNERTYFEGSITEIDPYYFNGDFIKIRHSFKLEVFYPIPTDEAHGFGMDIPLQEYCSTLNETASFDTRTRLDRYHETLFVLNHSVKVEEDYYHEIAEGYRDLLIPKTDGIKRFDQPVKIEPISSSLRSCFHPAGYRTFPECLIWINLPQAFSFSSPDEDAYLGRNSGIVQPISNWLSGIDYEPFYARGELVTEATTRKTWKYIAGSFVDNPVPPPVPPTFPEEEEMSCCSQVLAYLAYLNRKVDRLSQIIGVEEYPASLPQTFISTDSNSNDNNTEIPNLTRLLGWYVERFDEIMGQWEVAIDIEDADAVEAGNQSLKVRVPNIAEAISELLMQSINNTVNTEALISITTRALLEAGMTKQQSFINYWMLDTLIDYFGFQTREVSKSLALTFKPGEEDLEKLLVEGEVPVKVTELSDTTTFKVNMQDLLQAAAITRAANWRGFENNGDIKQNFIDLIKGYASVRQNLSNEKKDENGKDDLDHFLDDAERGFIDTAGITDSTNPYGRNLSERPRIRRIGNQTPTEDT